MAVFFICGDQDYLRQRGIQTLIRDRISKGWLVDYSDGSNISELISHSFSVFSQPTLAVVVNPAKLDAQVVASGSDLENLDFCFTWEGKPRAKSDYATVSQKYKDHLHRFDAVSPWKEDEQAEAFLLNEAKRYNKILSPGMAKVIVQLVGTDLGILSFEILKMKTLADVGHSKEILKPHVKGALARITEASIMPFVEALGKKSLPDLMRQALRIKQTHVGDPTMRICGFLTPQVLKWSVVSSLRDKGMVSQDIAERTGENPWFLKNKVLPQAVAWGYAKSKKLLAAIATSERAVKDGVIDPWTFFLCQLLELVSE